MDDEKKKTKEPFVSERALKGHLSNGNGKKEKKEKTKTEAEGPSEKMKARLPLDTQLQRALDLLRGLHALHG